MWAHLEDAVREGTPRWKQTFGVEGGIWAGYFRTEETKRNFLKGMHGFGRISSPAVAAAFDLSRFHRLIDLGGASGHLVEAVRERYPKIAGAGIRSARSGQALSRIRLRATSSPIRCRRRTSTALEGFCTIGRTKRFTGCLPGSMRRCPKAAGLLVAEKLLTPDYVSAHMQSMNMLVNAEGRERSAAEYEALLRAAGFSNVESRVTGAYLDAVLAVK